MLLVVIDHFTVFSIYNHSPPPPPPPSLRQTAAQHVFCILKHPTLQVCMSTSNYNLILYTFLGSFITCHIIITHDISSSVLQNRYNMWNIFCTVYKTGTTFWTFQKLTVTKQAHYFQTVLVTNALQCFIVLIHVHKLPLVLVCEDNIWDLLWMTSHVWHSNPQEVKWRM